MPGGIGLDQCDVAAIVATHDFANGLQSVCPSDLHVQLGAHHMGGGYQIAVAGNQEGAADRAGAQDCHHALDGVGDFDIA